MLPGEFPGDDAQQFSNESDERSGESDLCNHIKDIIDALHDIRSQLAEQNKYLDVLTEKYVKPPAQIVYEDGWETEDESGGWDQADQWTSNQWDDSSEWNDELQPAHEDQSHDFPADVMQPQVEAPESETSTLIDEEIRQETIKEVPKEPILTINNDDQNLYPSGFTDATGYYLSVGLVASLVCMHLFHSNNPNTSQNTNTIMLLLVTYALATWALWFLRDADLIKRVLGAWNPTGIPMSDQRSGRSRLPELMMG
ncbi:uncharacterized protein BDV17DRAFT_272233 [Aspergillus undulatus]|uniref:uncharacterized protein n=1 Tax=Aspergillus undulatus TaxID=1810928 RepID=UPI003CCDACEB